MAGDSDWIEKMHMKKGALRRETGTKPGRDISKSAERKALKSKSPLMRKRARLAMTLAGLRKKA